MTGFTLTERSGKEVQWKELEGQVSVTSFFFSSCPALCLQQNQKVREIQRSYQGKDVVFVSITCDPDIDTPTRLREYADKLQADHQQWLFLTGELTYIRRVAGELFRVPMDKQTHSEKLIVADKWGNIRDSFHWNKLDEVTKLRLLVDKLLAETEEPGFRKRNRVVRRPDERFDLGFKAELRPKPT
jgi:cytochrome oxidase Cu insertion factor (SCO1/SenC/PrrC family)